MTEALMAVFVFVVVMVLAMWPRIPPERERPTLERALVHAWANEVDDRARGHGHPAGHSHTIVLDHRSTK